MSKERGLVMEAGLPSSVHGESRFGSDENTFSIQIIPDRL